MDKKNSQNQFVNESGKIRYLLIYKNLSGQNFSKFQYDTVGILAVKLCGVINILS